MSQLAKTSVRLSRGVFVLILLATISIYALEANGRRLAFPTPFDHADQNAYLEYARKMRATDYAFVGNRNRMPVLPFLLSRLYQPGETAAGILERAQAFCVALSAALLLILAAILRQYFSRFETLALVIAAAFGVFLYRAGIVQVESLFFVINFGAFVLLFQMLLTPRWSFALTGGAVLGLAFLTKASALPAFACWAVVFVVQSFKLREVASETTGRYLVKRCALLLLVTATFLLVVWPYIWTSKQRYGQFFYNVNTAHYMWCDSWREALTYSARLQGPPVDDPRLPELPSFSKYWRQHTALEMFSRFLKGLFKVTTRSLSVIGYYKFVAGLGIITLILSIRRRARARELVARHPFVVAFCLMYFCVYLILFAWYSPVVTDSRFNLTLFLPFVFAAGMTIQKLAREDTIMIGGRTVPITVATAAAVISLALIDLLYNVRHIA